MNFGIAWNRLNLARYIVHVAKVYHNKAGKSASDAISCLDYQVECNHEVFPKTDLSLIGSFSAT